MSFSLPQSFYSHKKAQQILIMSLRLLWLYFLIAHSTEAFDDLIDEPVRG
jgi:hypothetical protein